MAYKTNTGGRIVVVGGTLWSVTPWQDRQRSKYGAGEFRTRSWHDWKDYAQSTQLVSVHDVDGRLTADIALMSPTLPVRFRLRVDVSTRLESQVGMTACGDFRTESYSEYGASQRIDSPPR
jgi:hypothetical protein